MWRHLWKAWSPPETCPPGSASWEGTRTQNVHWVLFLGDGLWCLLPARTSPGEVSVPKHCLTSCVFPAAAGRSSRPAGAQLLHAAIACLPSVTLVVSLGDPASFPAPWTLPPPSPDTTTHNTFTQLYTIRLKSSSCEVDTSLHLFSAQRKKKTVFPTYQHVLLKNVSLSQHAHHRAERECRWFVLWKTDTWVMHSERWWICTDPFPLAACLVLPVTNGRHLRDSWRGEGCRLRLC